MESKLLTRDGSLPGEPSQSAGSALLFLREEQMRLAQEMFFLAYRDLTAAADELLVELDLGRAHHRVLHFVAGRPRITVSDLLGLLRITKQSLGRVLGELVTRGYVVQQMGQRDRRQRLLSLTESGRQLERRLFERQRERILHAYRESGGVAVEGFRRVMRAMLEAESRVQLDGRETECREAGR